MYQISRLSLIALFALTVLTGCSRLQKSLGLDRQSPDESKVVTTPKLAIPPNFDLRAPSQPTESSDKKAAE